MSSHRRSSCFGTIADGLIAAAFAPRVPVVCTGAGVADALAGVRAVLAESAALYPALVRNAAARRSRARMRRTNACRKTRRQRAPRARTIRRRATRPAACAEVRPAAFACGAARIAAAFIDDEIFRRRRRAGSRPAPSLASVAPRLQSSQADLANALSARGLPVWPAVRRRRSTRPQFELDADARHANVRAAFTIGGWTPWHRARWARRHRRPHAGDLWTT